MEVVELSPGEVRGAAPELARLLLDAHASNMALGLRGPLTDDLAHAAWVDTADRLGEDRVLWVARDDDGATLGTVQLVRAGGNGRHRAEIQRLAVRADARGGGLGRRLLEVAVDRARELGLKLLWLTTHAETDADGFYERVGWTRMGVVPAWSERPDGTLAANVFYYREL